MTDLAPIPIRLNLNNPVEALSYIPYRLGFKPAASIVFLAVSYVQGAPRLGFAARVDIADALNPDTRDSLRLAILRQVNKDDPVQVHVAIYDDAVMGSVGDFGGTSSAVRRKLHSLSSLLSHWYEHEAFHPSHTYLVGQHTWRCLTCDHPEPCPPQGRPVIEFETAMIAAQMVVNGRAIAPSREELISIPRQNSQDLRRARYGAELELTAYLDSAIHGKRWSWRASMVRKWQRAHREVLMNRDSRGSDVLAPELIGRLTVGLFDVLLRDSVIYSLCSGADILHPETDDLGSELDELLRPGAQGPDEVSNRGLLLLETVVAHSDTDMSVPALGAWAWCHWWHGNGAQANLLVEQCLRLDPEYSLATLLDTMLVGHVRPPWTVEAP